MSRPCYLYLICHQPNKGPVKIGISSHPGSRLMELQTGNPYTLQLFRTHEFEHRSEAADLERHFHSTMASGCSNWVLRGEWLNASPAEASCFLYGIAGKYLDRLTFESCGMAYRADEMGVSS